MRVCTPRGSAVRTTPATSIRLMPPARIAVLASGSGTLADAKTDGSAIAVLLIQEFETTSTEPHKHDVNARVLDDFVLRLGGPDLERTGTSAAWITAPINLRGDGVWTPTKLPVSVAKLKRLV